MLIKESQIFNLMDTNGRRRDVLNALKIYLEILQEIKLEYPDALWEPYPRSIAQFVFYQRALKRSASVFKEHKKYDRFMENIGARIEPFLMRSCLPTELGLTAKDWKSLDIDIEARARHYTSNLVKMGFADGNRNISKAGSTFLKGSTTRDELETMLPIDDTNLVTLRQLLKLRIFSAPDPDGNRQFYAPVIMALLLLICNERINHDTLFNVVQSIGPYFNEDKQRAILQHLDDLPTLERLATRDEAVVPLPFLSESLLPYDEFSAHIKNQKSGDMVYVYYAFYTRLYVFRQAPNERTYAALKEILQVTKARTALSKAFGCGQELFDMGHGRGLSLEEFLELNQDNEFLNSPALNRDFYLAYHRSSRLDDIREYSDTTKRLLSATGIFKFERLPELAYKEMLQLIFQPDILKSMVFGVASREDYEAYEVAPECIFRGEQTLTQILGYSSQEVTEISMNIATLLGVADPREIQAVAQDKASSDFIRHVEQKYPREKVLELLPLFSDRRNDRKIQAAVNDAAPVPTIYEYIVGIAWYYISGRDFNLYTSLNLTLDADFEPVIHAAGGDGDIVIHYDDLVLMLEVTLMNKQAQKRGEWEPVLRHSLNLKAVVEPKEAMTFFIADELDYNTTNIWRAVAAAPLESTNTHQPVTGAIIMPFTTEEFIQILTAGISRREIMDRVRASFAEVPPIANTKWKEKIMEQLCPMQ